MTPAELILAQFPGRVFITLVEAGKALGMTAQTAYNKHHKGTFPLPVRKIGKKPMVSLSDFIAFMTQGSAQPAPPTPQPRRRPGRPRNAERE